MIDQFRQEVYQSFAQRADAGLDPIDALTSALNVGLPTISDSLVSQLGFNSVSNVLWPSKVSRTLVTASLACDNCQFAEVVVSDINHLEAQMELRWMEI